MTEPNLEIRRQFHSSTLVREIWSWERPNSQEMCFATFGPLKFIDNTVLLQNNVDSPRKIAGIRDDIPRKSHRDILVADQPVAVVPEVVLGVHASIVQQGVLASQDDLIPQNYLMAQINPSSPRTQTRSPGSVCCLASGTRPSGTRTTA